MQSDRPNILLIVADGMQAETIGADHACQTPRIDELSNRGVRFMRAHTTCPTCSPARASMMTGLLPHNHGVLEVEHGRDSDQCVLRTEHPHFAQRLRDAGYTTGYFGKWHIERTQDVHPFGWEQAVVKGAEHVRNLGRGDAGPKDLAIDESLCGHIEGPPGYQRLLHWGVTDVPLYDRYPGITALDAEQFLEGCSERKAPWCCCVSFAEPNEALVVGREMWQRYDPAHHSAELPANFANDFSDRPNIYRREQLIGQELSEEHWLAARACYFGRISEVDQIAGRLIDRLHDLDAFDDTLILFLADHGRYVGAHGFDAHNFGAFEEIYRIPLVVAGPGVVQGRTCDGQVSIADVAPTLCDIASSTPIEVADSRSFASLLRAPEAVETFEVGYAEYHGTRFPLMQRVLWQDDWKFVFNGFDFDELYNLRDDPYEMHNLARDPAEQTRMIEMMTEIWRKVSETNDRTILESHYFSMRFACVGPHAASSSTR